MIDVWNDLALRWAQIFGAAVIQNTVFVLLVLLALRLLRDAPARVRHAVTLVGLVKLLLPPVLTLPLGKGAVESALTAESGFAPLIFGGSEAATGGGATAAPVMPGVLAILLAVWALGAAAWLLTSVVCTSGLWWRLRRTERIPARDLPAVLPVGVTVHRSARIAMPLTLGPWPRRIYVPTAWDYWSAECRALALRHELLHLDRRDGLWQCLQMVARAFYFFHPLVWLLDREIEATREMAVDDAAAGAGEKAGVTYSRHLMDIAESLACGTETCGTAAALFRRRRELMGRIRYQLQKGEEMKTWTRKTAFVLVALLALTIPLSWHLGAAESEIVIGNEHEVAMQQDEKAKKAEQAQKEEQVQKAETVKKVEKAHTAEVATDGEKVELKVVLKGDGVMKVKGKKMHMADFEKKLAHSGLAEKDVVFTIVCTEGTTMGDVHVFSAMAREVWEHPKARFMTADGQKVPMYLPSKKIHQKLATLDEKQIAGIHVAADGKVTFAGHPISCKKVAFAAEEHLKKDPEMVFTVSSDAQTSYNDYAMVLTSLKKAGAERIAIMPIEGLAPPPSKTAEAREVATP